MRRDACELQPLLEERRVVGVERHGGAKRCASQATKKEVEGQEGLGRVSTTPTQ